MAIAAGIKIQNALQKNIYFFCSTPNQRNFRYGVICHISNTSSSDLITVR